MIRALHNWLETHGLLAIATAVLVVLLLLATILVVGGYMIVAR
jgi:hypothetical protein